MSAAVCWWLGGHDWETLDVGKPLRAGGTPYKRRCRRCGKVESFTLSIDS